MFTVVDVNGLNGGLSYGMVQAGGKLLYRTGYLNLGQHIINANASLWGDGWEDHINPTMAHQWNRWHLAERANVVVAVPPCSGFSGLTGKGAGRGSGNSITASAEHPMNDCMWSSARYAARHRPDVYLFESVTGAFKSGRDVMQGLRAEIERISGSSYTLTHWLHDGCVVGAPSSRQRYLFVAVRGDRPFGVCPVVDYARDTFVPMRDAISDLEQTPVRYGLQPIASPETDFQKRAQRADGLVDGHFVVERGKWHFVNRAVHRAAREMGAPWQQGENASECMRRIHAHYGDQKIIDIAGERVGERQIRLDFNMGPYCATREVWDAMCGLIAGGGPIYHEHPHLDRVLTYREVARIQGWPDELAIEFDAKRFGKEKIDAVWGKSVMPTVAIHIAQEVSRWLQEYPTQTDNGVLIGDREWLIDDLEPAKLLRRQNQQVKRRVRLEEIAAAAAAGVYDGPTDIGDRPGDDS